MTPDLRYETESWRSIKRRATKIDGMGTKKTKSTPEGRRREGRTFHPHHWFHMCVTPVGSLAHFIVHRLLTLTRSSVAVDTAAGCHTETVYSLITYAGFSFA